MTKIIDRRSIDFLLFDVFDVESLCGRGRYADHDRESLSAVLDLAQRLAEEHLWSHAALADTHEPRLQNGRVHILAETTASLNVLKEAGFFACGNDYELGGMQLPVTVDHACNSMFKGANVATSGYMMLTRAAANLLAVYGTPDQQRRFMLPMLAGRFFGTMCLSEPDVGSSLGDLRTRAEPLGEGRYAVSGNKMWISAGDHDAAENIVHLVLARTVGAPAGSKGISLFAVPKLRVNDDGSLGAPNGISVAGLNHKMGYRGTSNCLLNFGERETSEGFLVGSENHGLAGMFHMMNAARIGVGIGAAMLASVGYQVALQYARERKQGRRLGSKDPAQAPVPIIAHPDVRHMLLKQKVYSEGAIALCLYAGTLVDRLRLSADEAEQARLNDLLDVLTPIVKAWPSEFGLEANKLAIQVLGGYGYTRDFPLERLYRDNRLNMIHEGTNGIQALDLLGRKAVINEGRAFAALLSEVEDTVGEAKRRGMFDEHAAALLALLARARQTTDEVRRLLGEAQAERALANATLFLHASGHLVVGWLWLKTALAAQVAIDAGSHKEQTPFLRGKVHACEYFFAHEIPLAATWLQTSAAPPALVLEFDDDGF